MIWIFYNSWEKELFKPVPKRTQPKTNLKKYLQSMNFWYRIELPKINQVILFKIDIELI